MWWDVWQFTQKIFSPANDRPPKFDEIVKVVIATLAVFTGVALKDYITGDGIPDHQGWAFVALVSLLLRYIIGSAVHLTYTYARKDDLEAEPNSTSVVLLAKDFGFVVAFGVFAVRMAEAQDLADFWYFAKCFLAAGLIWTVFDWIVRGIWSSRPSARHEWPKRPFWIVWGVLDAAQLALTCVIPRFCPVYQVEILGIAYALFLLADLKVMARIMQVPVQQVPAQPKVQPPVQP